MAKIIDISQPLKAGIPVWPGDSPFAFTSNWVLEGDCPVNVGKLSLSTHTGAHADAPYHYSADGRTMEQVDVGRYIGPCLVVDARGAGEVITPEDFELPETVERVLFRTFEAFPYDGWPEGFAAIHPDTIHLIADKGGVLVGIDTPSIDPEQSKTLDAHKAVLARDLSILEGLVLEHAPAGAYELIAPPLRIEGGDASPVRALLREIEP